MPNTPAGGQQQAGGTAPDKPNATSSQSGTIPVTNIRLFNLNRMYERAVTQCLYYKANAGGWNTFFNNSFNFADVVVASIVPALAFSHANQDTIALASTLVTLFGGQLKSAVTGVTGGSGSSQDFGQTLAEMQTIYNLFVTDPYFQGTLSSYDPFNSDDANFSKQFEAYETFHMFKVGMEYACFSSLGFSSTASQATKSGSQGSGTN